ncbi:MAG: hypothetical protein HC843_05685 [Sphingomonadales bacterium]|nr:hypothetical protein [Sphingomonadales bacterium]
MMKNNVKLSVFLVIFYMIAGPQTWVKSWAQSESKTPYWASLDESEARMRTGPSTEFPVKWVYKRKDLPLKVVDRHSVWRKVEDPDGDQGWMHVRLLSPTRTALVIGTSNGALRDAPSPTARIAWRVEPGVVGRIDDCQKDGADRRCGPRRLY